MEPRGEMIQLARNTEELIHDLCRQFGETTGWKLRYQSGSGRPATTMAESADPPGFVQPIHNGETTVGMLVVDQPEAVLAGEIPEGIRGLIEQLGLVLSQLAQAEQALANRTEAVKTLSGLGKVPRSERELGDHLRELLAAAARLTGFHSAGFFLLNPSTNRLKLRATWNLDPHNLPASNREVASSRPDVEALARGSSSLIRKSELDDRWLPAGASCGLCAAVQSSVAPMGTLWVYDRRMHDLNARESESLRTIADHIALLLERVVLVRENEAQRRIQRELRSVSESKQGIQRPQLAPECGFDAVYRCLSRHEVGGDLCEIEPLTDQSTVIVVGDASGNNMPAALVMNAAKGALKSMAGWRRAVHDWHPSLVMDRLNRAVQSVTGDHQFMSLYYGVYDASTRILSSCNAGHPAPILLRNGQAILLETPGLLLGVSEDAEYDSVETQMEAGDLLVLLSDGITESWNDDHGLFGSQGVIDAIANAPDDSVNAIFESIWHAAEEYPGQGAKKKVDDRTLLVMRIH